MSTDPFRSTQSTGGLKPQPPARSVLGARYELAALLGSGGMGNVYRARDLELEEDVAVKVLRAEIAAVPGTIERFRREVRLARRVTHPNVARVYDIGEHAGAKILTMELVDGEPLSALLRREGARPIAHAIELACAISAGVGAAHAAGVIHRDLKPDNVLLAKDGRILVSDFGIAHAAAGDEASKTVGAFAGTPAYMAPEQVEGIAIDARADMYAFGVMLYELMTAALPWQGESAFAIAAARLMRPPPDPRAIRPDVGDRMAELILRCLARRPDDRFGKMADISSALAAITPTSTLPAQPRRPRDAAPTPTDHKRVAVLPFRNSGAPGDGYVAEALTDDLIDLLSVAPGLRVQSRGTVVRYRDVDTDPRQVGRELGVQVVVEGNVRKIAGVFRISARLGRLDDSPPQLAMAMRVRTAMWRRDVAAATALRTALPATEPLYPMLKSMLDATLGEPLPEGWFAGWPRSHGMRQRAIFAQMQAEVATVAGATALALETIELADDLRLFDLPWMDRCPSIEPLRGDPRFAAVRARVAERADAIQRAYQMDL